MQKLYFFAESMRARNSQQFYRTMLWNQYNYYELELFQGVR